MYHLTTKDVTSDIRTPKEDAELIVEKLIKKFKNCLKNNGLVVFGENESLQMGDNKIVPKVMKKLGFTPLNGTNKHKPNVWKLSISSNTI